MFAASLAAVALLGGVQGYLVYQPWYYPVYQVVRQTPSTPSPEPVVIELVEFDCPAEGLFPIEEGKDACKDYYMCRKVDGTIKVIV